MKIDRGNLRGIAGVLTALVIIGVIHLLKPGVSSVPDFSCESVSTSKVAIDIRTGETGSEIAQELFDKGVTASFQSFFRVAVGDSRSTRIAPGLHQIEANELLISETQAPSLIESKLVIRAGSKSWLSADVAQIFVSI